MRIKRDLKKVNNIYEIIKQNNDEKDISNMLFDENKKCCKYCSLFICFKLIGPLFVIFNLISIYQLIGILNTTKGELLLGIKSFFLEKKELKKIIIGIFLIQFIIRWSRF